MSRAAIGAWLLLGIACAGGDTPASLEALVQRGDELAQRREYADAIKAYRDAVDLDPLSGELHYKLAQARWANREWEDGLREGLRAADLLPDNKEIQWFAVNQLMSMSRFVDVADRTAAILEQEPRNVVALIMWGNAKANLMSSTWAFYRLAEAMRSPDAFESVRLTLRPQVRADVDRAAAEAFQRALEVDPAWPDAQFALPNLLWAQGQLDEAEPLLRRAADQHPGQSAVNHALGEFYLARGRNEEGERYLKVAAAGEGYGGRARFPLVDYYMRAGREPDARTVLDSMLATDDAEGEVSVRFAEIERRLNQRSAALSRLDQLLTRLPNKASALVLKSTLLLAENRRDEAMQSARAAIALDTRLGEAHFALGQAYAVGGDSEGAFRAFSEAVRLLPGSFEAAREVARFGLRVGRNAEALEYARQAARLRPDDADVAMLLVQASIRAREFDAAGRQLQSLLAKQPNAPDALTAQAAIQAGRGDRVAARATYARVLAIHPASFEALYGLVTLELDDRNVPAARARIEAVLGANPDARVLVLASRVYAAAGDTARVETTLRQALAREPAYTAAVVALSDALVTDRRYSEAEQVLREFMARQPESVEARLALAAVYERMRRLNDARDAYAHLVSSVRGDARAASRLARLYATRGDRLDEALSLALRAREQAGDAPEVADALGWVYVQRGSARVALTLVQEAVDAEPNNPLYLYHLGMAFEGMGEFTRARDHVRRALELDSGFLGSEDAQASLARLLRMAP